MAVLMPEWRCFWPLGRILAAPMPRSFFVRGSEAVEVIGQIGQRQFRLGTREPNGADKQTVAVLLLGKDVLDIRTHR